MKTIAIGLCVFIIIATLLSGVALGAQTSVDLKVTGNSFSDVNYKMDTPMGLPYEGNDYSLNIFMVGGEDVTHSHYLDVGNGIEAETTLVANESDGVILIDESVRKDVIGETGINENVSAAHCYSASAGYSVAGSALNYESAAQVSGLGLDYTVTAAGRGGMRWVSTEYLSTGEIVAYADNTSKDNLEEGKEEEMNEEDIPMPDEGEDASTFWTSSYVEEDVRANGVFEFAGSYHSEFSDFPAPAPDEELDHLCPFGWGE